MTQPALVDADPRSRKGARRRSGRAAAGRRGADRRSASRSRSAPNASLAAARDLVDFARHRGRVLTGRLQLGVIPTLAPYVLPKILPVLQRRYPELRVELRETQTRALLDELDARHARRRDAGAAGRRSRNRDACRCSTIHSCSRCRRPTRAPRRARVTRRDIDQQRLILLEEGHCLRDQALVVLRDAAAAMRLWRYGPRRHQSRDRDADGRERIWHHAGAARRGRCRSCATSA